MGARELNSTEPAGSTSAAHEAKPAAVILRGVSEMVAHPSSLRSFGVAQEMSPPQYSGTDVLGVAPDTMVQHSSRRTSGHAPIKAAPPVRGVLVECRPRARRVPLGCPWGRDALQ